MLKPDDISWGSCSKKQESRNIIIQSYKYYTGHTKLPKRKQYWALCGECVSNSKLITNSEPDQLISAGLITPIQYHGVEINEEIYNINNQYNGINWYCGDIYKVIQSIPKSHFNPGIIHFDTTQFPESTIITFRRIISWINYLNIKEVMVVYNINLSSFKSIYKRNQQQMEDVIFGDINLREYLKEGWILPEVYTSYPGTGTRSCSNMISLIFYKK